MNSSTWLFKLFIFWFGMASCVLHASASDQQSEWQIVPSTCINNKPGDLCRVEITITFPKALLVKSKTAPEEVCFYVEQALLSCITIEQPDVKIPVAITQSSTLEIRIKQQTVARKQLFVQSLAPNNTRRRVRNPWSFF